MQNARLQVPWTSGSSASLRPGQRLPLSIPGFSEVAAGDEQPAQPPSAVHTAPRLTLSELSHADVLPGGLNPGFNFEQFSVPAQDEAPAASIEPEGLSLLARLRLILGYATMELLHGGH